MTKTRGLSLIEVLITLGVIAVIALFIRPQLLELDGYRSQTRGYFISSLFQTGSNMALVSANQIVLCPSNNNSDCSYDWNTAPWILFVNTNGNSKRDTNETILHRVAPDTNTQLSFNGNTPRFLRWYATGHINRAFSLTICPRNHDPHNARVLIMNLQGRVREGPDTNNNGVAELGDGQEARCKHS